MVLTLPKEKTDDQTDKEYLSYLQDFDPAQDFLDKYTESTDPTKTDFGVEAYKGDEGRGFFSPDGSGRPDEEVAAPKRAQFESSRDTSVEQPSRTEPVRSVGERADSFTRTVDRRTVNRDERPSTRPTTLAKDLVGVRAENQGSASPLEGRTGGSSQFVGSRQTGTSTSFNTSRSANPNQTGFRGFFNRVRDTVTPSAYEYGGNIAKSAFQGGEQVNRTSFQDSDVQNLFERSDNIPVTVGPRTRFSDTKVYENEQGQLVPHTDETLKQFSPNARNQITDYTGGPDLGPLESVPGVTPIRTAGSMLRYGYENPLGVRGESYIEYNQPDRFTPPTAEFSDAAYLNLKSDDPNETTWGQGVIGSAIHRLTGNKTDIVGTEFARASLPYEGWSDEMKLQAGMPDFNQSMEMSDVLVDQYGNPKTDEESRQLRQALLGTTAIGREVSGSQRQKAADEFIAGIENWEPLTDQSTFEDIPEVQGEQAFSSYGATNQPSTVDLNKSTELPPPPTADDFLEEYIPPSQPYDQQEPVGNYIKNEETGEIVQLADAPESGTLPSDNFKYIPPIALSEERLSAASQAEEAAGDDWWARREAKYRSLGLDPNKPYGGKPWSYQSQFDAAHKRLDAAQAAHARNYDAVTSRSMEGDQTAAVNSLARTKAAEDKARAEYVQWQRREEAYGRSLGIY